MKQLSLSKAKRTHIAIMRKSWGLTQKILTGEKTIESRWYINKYQPWDKIEKEDTVYFKDSGEPVNIKAKVAKVEQYQDLTPKKVKRILSQYAIQDGLGINKIKEFHKLFKNKKYCLIIFLKNIKKIKSFEINKSGYGAMASWIITNNIERIKK